MTLVAASVRAEIAILAEGRCEYCLVHEDDTGFRHEVDHVISLKHGGQSTRENLAYACVSCNRFKGSDIGALDLAGNLVQFFNPRKQLWHRHFRLDGAVIQPLTAEAEATVKILPNQPERIAERHLLQELKRYPRR